MGVLVGPIPQLVKLLRLSALGTCAVMPSALDSTLPAAVLAAFLVDKWFAGLMGCYLGDILMRDHQRGRFVWGRYRLV